ncbi:MAG: hypothetical protein WC802_04270 [Patescibacteria group bacterium]
MPNTLKAAGLIAFIWNQGNPPPNTEPLQEWQQEQVNDVLKTVDAETPFVQRLLERADPLFDLERKEHEDNTVLIGQIGQLQTDVHYYADHDRIRVLASLERAEKNSWGAYFAEGGMLGPHRERDFEDSWIVVEKKQDDPDYIYIDVGVLMHEAAHNYALHHYGLKKMHNMGMPETLKKRDGSYLTENLYSIAEKLTRVDSPQMSEAFGPEGARGTMRALFDITSSGYIQASYIGGEEDIIDEKALQKKVSFIADKMLTGYQLTQEQWASERVQTLNDDTTNFGGKRASEFENSGMNDVGITAEELQEVLEESPELFKLRNQHFYEEFERLENLFPYQYAEWKEAVQKKEKDAERTGEVKPAGRR